MYNFESFSGITYQGNGTYTWLIISLVVAIIGGITLYFVYLNSKKKIHPFLDKLRDFLNFKKLYLTEILKITYLILAIYTTLSSFALIGIDFASFLLNLVWGNVVLRAVYEIINLLIRICDNTSEINSKLKK